MTFLSKTITSRILAVASAGILATTASFALAQDMTPELDAWLKTNALGSYSSGSEDWDAIVAAANAEGEVVIYSSSGRIAKLKDHFEALYPAITLTLFDLGSVKTIEKPCANKMPASMVWTLSPPETLVR